MSFVITLDQMESFSDAPGEAGHLLEGYKHGFDSTSLIRTETAPGGGPPLHTHHCEEIHVLPACRMAYIIGDERFEVAGPCAVRIPAYIPHTFTNIGTAACNLICFFPDAKIWEHYEEVGANPLLA
jgi:mannose-6-phosphate isomerase-like protein (cupin superfamily)